MAEGTGLMEDRPSRSEAPRGVGGIVFGAVAAILLSSETLSAENSKATTKVNQDVVIGSFAQYTNSCVANGMPSIKIDRPPQSGKVFTRTGPFTIRSDQVFSLPHCTGKTVNGIWLFYSPSPGFVGTDKVTVTITWLIRNKPQRGTYIITVDVTPED
jgi:hypothetical protein